MWRFKPFIAKEPAGLEGRVLDVGNVKIQVQNVIAEGGFSCVYLARDAVNLSRQYALKHMICQDGESLDLAVKEISVMKLLKGHPNVVTLVAHTMLDMGRRKEVLLVMEFCEKSLVTVLESRGSGYFDEKQVLLLFRDICNAVFAMHCQSPPIAHRDLKVENILLGSDGAWKLCDFGSTTTNHKCFDRPEEMGIEEDNIRKYTTPAYRAPEMWDLYRREVISEKVDIWALGCLLYRICYFKLAFDGESKLQILNGNYRIPELPKYSASLTSLIKDMLESSPDARPDITQVWFRVNCLLPVESQKDLPDGSVSSSAIGMHSPASNEGAAKRTAVMPRRSPPPPPSSREQTHKISPQSERDVQHSRPSRVNAKVTSAGDSLGAFWSTQHALDSQVLEKGPIFDEEPICQLTPKHNQTYSERRKSVHGDPSKGPSNSSGDDFEIRFSPEKKPLQTETKAAFNAFAADSNTANNTYKNGRLGKVEELEAEVISLREQLKQANLEKTEIASKYDKLSAICRSQRQELQELKRILAASTPSPSSRDSHKNLDGQLSRQELKRNFAAPTPSPSSRDSPKTPDNPPREREKIEGTVWELQQGIFESSPSSPDSHPWQAFPEEPKRQNATPISVKTANGFQDSPIDEWGFGQDNFRAAPTSNSEASMVRSAQGSTSHRFGGSETTSKLDASQPAGWAGF